jgi:hypothetical protein
MEPEHSANPRARALDVAPVAAAAIIAAGVALAAYLIRPTTRSRAVVTEQQLLAYLRDHLSGADAAIHIVRRLASSHGDVPDGRLFAQLLQEFEQDRATVQSLLIRSGASERSAKRIAGAGAGRLLSVAADGKPGDLSLFRTLEAVAIGIQGKRCMWRALQELGAMASADREMFVELESRAVRQWERIEQRRRALAPTTFTDPGSASPARAL